MKDREAWHAVVPRVAKSYTELRNWTITKVSTIAIRFLEIDFYMFTHAHVLLLLFLWRTLTNTDPTPNTDLNSYISENIAISTGTQLQILHEEQKPPPTWPIMVASVRALREKSKFSQAVIFIAQQINAGSSWNADLLFKKSRSISGGRGLSYWRFILKLGSSGEGDFSDRKLSALHTGASQCSPESSNLNAMHTPVASELTAISVLKVQKEVNKKKKRKKGEKKEIYSQCHYEQFNEDICSMPSGGQSLDKTGLCEGDGGWDAEILLCHSINQHYILTLNMAAKAGCLISTKI